MEPCGPHRACYGAALPLHLCYIYPMRYTYNMSSTPHKMDNVERNMIFMCVIPVVCVTNKKGGVVKQHN